MRSELVESPIENPADRKSSETTTGRTNHNSTKLYKPRLCGLVGQQKHPYTLAVFGYDECCAVLWLDHRRSNKIGRCRMDESTSVGQLVSGNDEIDVV